MTTDVLIIGGGLAGASAAIRLSLAGVGVTLVERERTPAHKVCGEFLSGESLFYLRQLGIDVETLGAVPIDRVRLAHGNGAHDSALPFAAMSLTRRTLDFELLRCAERAGVQVLRGCTVERANRVGAGWSAHLASGEEIASQALFVATGKHDLRGHARTAGRGQDMVAFKMYWQLDAAEMRKLGNAVELITYRGGYAGLQPVENGLANLCCLIRVSELRRLGGNWSGLLAHMRHQSRRLRSRLRNAIPILAKPLTIASLPYGFIRRDTDGPWYLGDQAAVIPSFTGDGMSLALHTGALAAEMYLRNEAAQRYLEVLRKQVNRQIGIAMLASKAMVLAPGLALMLPQIWPGFVSAIARRTRVAPAAMASLESYCRADSAASAA